MQLKDPVDTKLCTLKFINLSAVVGLTSGLTVRKLWERRLAWKEKWRHSYDSMKPAASSMSTRERSSGLGSKVSTWSSWETTISSCLVRCSKPRSLPGTLSLYSLPTFSHFVAHGRPSQNYVWCLRTVMNLCCLSVQWSSRCAQAIHCEYIHLSSWV